MTRYALLLLVTSTVFTITSSSAETIDFEGLGLSEGTLLTTIPAFPEVHFSNAILVLPGAPRFGFQGNSGGGSGSTDDALSGATMSAPDNTGGTVVVTFDRPVKDLVFDAVDIEIASYGVELITTRVFDAVIGGTLLHTFTLTGGDPGTGDGILTPINLSSGFLGSDQIRRFEFEGAFVPGGSDNPGYAIDNLSFTLVPEPSSFYLVTIGLFALAGVSRCRRR